MTTDLKDKLATARAAQETGLTTKGRPDTVLGWLNAPTTALDIEAALPRGQDYKRWIRIIQTEVRKNPKLLEADYRSFALAVLAVAQLALEPGPLGHSYLTGPFKNGRTGLLEVVPILGYKGLVDLAYRAGTVDLIDAVVVRKGEPFRIVRGSDQRLEHEELASCSDNEVVAYYAIAFPKGGGRAVFEVMWPDEIDAIRKRSRAKDDGPWKTDFEAMALKSPIRRMLNRGKVRLSPEVATAIAEDEAREFGHDRPELLTSLSLEDLGGKESKKSKEPETSAAAEGDDAASAGQTASNESPSAASTDPTQDPSAPGSILRDQPAEDPGAAFRQQAHPGRDVAKEKS